MIIPADFCEIEAVFPTLTITAVTYMLGPLIVTADTRQSMVSSSGKTDPVPDIATAADAELYGPEFFQQWGTANEEFRRCVTHVAGTIHRRYKPETIIDFGCGPGIHAAELIRLGSRVTCLDAFVCPPQYRAPGIEEIHVADLSVPIAPGRFAPADMSLCMDVAEHLPHEAAGTLVQNLCGHSDLVLISAAPPDQQGIGHINEQPRSYWIERFAAAGYRYCRKETGWFFEQGLALRDIITLRWTITNLMVFRRGLKYPYPPIHLPPQES